MIDLIGASNNVIFRIIFEDEDLFLKNINYEFVLSIIEMMLWENKHE